MHFGEFFTLKWEHSNVVFYMFFQEKHILPLCRYSKVNNGEVHLPYYHQSVPEQNIC